MAGNNPTEDPRASTNTSNIARRQHRGRRIAATLVVFTLLGGTGMAITAGSASAEPNDLCQDLQAVYQDQTINVGNAFAAYATDVLESQWADAALALTSYQNAMSRAKSDYSNMKSVCG